jgi:hypothetical protein
MIFTYYLPRSMIHAAYMLNLNLNIFPFHESKTVYYLGYGTSQEKLQTVQ